MILIVARFRTRRPRRYGRRPQGGERPRLGSHHFTTVGCRTPQFYVLYLALLMMSTGGLLVTLNAGPMANSWGIAAGAVATSLHAVASGGRSSGDGRRIGSDASSP